MGVVVQEVMEELCRYGTDGESDLLKQTCSKVFSRNLGGRDVGILEAVHLGLNLPLVLAQISVVSLNTLGTRRVKTYAEQLREGVGEGQDVLHESRLDLFDRRLAIVKKQFCKNDKVKREWMEALASVSV